MSIGKRKWKENVHSIHFNFIVKFYVIKKIMKDRKSCLLASDLLSFRSKNFQSVDFQSCTLILWTSILLYKNLNRQIITYILTVVIDKLTFLCAVARNGFVSFCHRRSISEQFSRLKSQGSIIMGWVIGFINRSEWMNSTANF